MVRRLSYLFLVAALAALGVKAGSAHAQEAPPTSLNAGAYDALSTGNKIIVDAIYESQLSSFNFLSGGELLSRDDLAVRKESGGWGKAYKELYQLGLVSHSNLGLAISSMKGRSTQGTAHTNTSIDSSDTDAFAHQAKGAGSGRNFVFDLNGSDPYGLESREHGLGKKASSFGNQEGAIGDGGTQFGSQGKAFGHGASHYRSRGPAFSAGNSSFGAGGSGFGRGGRPGRASHGRR